MQLCDYFLRPNPGNETGTPWAEVEPDGVSPRLDTEQGI